MAQDGNSTNVLTEQKKCYLFLQIIVIFLLWCDNTVTMSLMYSSIINCEIEHTDVTIKNVPSQQTSGFQ